MLIIFKDMMRGSETFSPYIPTYGMDGERRNCMEDTDIIELYWSRSQEAIRETKKKYDKLCSHIADRILHSREDAEECVQDTYLAVWNRIPEERPSYFRAFLCKITRNIAMDRLDYNLAGKRSRQQTISFEELEETFSDTPNLTEGPVKQRRILVRRYFFMDSVVQIAADMNMNINSVKSILRRENRKLRAHLRKGGYGDDR